MGLYHQTATDPSEVRRASDLGPPGTEEQDWRRRMKSLAADAAKHRPAPAFLTYGFRPFFFAAALWSAAALLLWIVMFATGRTLPSRFDPLAWHIHEMLFGFVMAAIAGFLLTAIPNQKRNPRPIVGGFGVARKTVPAVRVKASAR
jgi:hypothetical protein